jgi:predicted component of viral defense system (DUF524 family)
MVPESIFISLDHLGAGVALEIIPEQGCHCRILSELEAGEHGECIYQIFEGHSYEYEFIGSENYKLSAIVDGIVLPSRRNSARGRVYPNIYVGTLKLFVTDKYRNLEVDELCLEVIATKFDQSVDSSYRSNYRKMLEDITDKCSELLMQTNAPVYQSFELDYDRDSKTIYQRFSFVKSILNTEDFEGAILKIISNPSTVWEQEHRQTDIGRLKRINNDSIRQLANGRVRVPVPTTSTLHKLGITSVSEKIQISRKVESFDNLENRFIKHSLSTFLQFTESCLNIFQKYYMERPAREARQMVTKLTRYLAHPFFKDIQPPRTLKLNSPVLQKRAGYREVLSRWLQFDLASKLIWKGGDDVYEAGKKDIATLYEYWLFFVLYDIVCEKFKVVTKGSSASPYGDLIEATTDGLNLKLKSGNYQVIQGCCERYHRNLSFKFTYNRSFKGNTTYAGQKAGSWTTTLRPDYTLSFWPSVFSEIEAEMEDAIVHIHFDAKYKIQDFNREILRPEDSSEEALNIIAQEERKGSFKNVDLLKMHAYKDAIRRTGGAYILYPGDKSIQFRGFHEIIPGLGAFTINPSLTNTGVGELSLFLDKVIENLLDRTSQRERIINKNHQILKDQSSSYESSHVRLPQQFDKIKLDLEDTYVLVGYLKSDQHSSWCISNGMYNFRMNDANGSLVLTKEVVSAKYLLLREYGQPFADKLFRILGDGPKVYSKKKLIDLGYASPSKDEYLIFKIEPIVEPELTLLKWDYKKLQEFEEIMEGKGSIYEKVGKPFVTSFRNLVRVGIKRG